MVVKTMIAIGVTLVVGAWILAVPYSPGATQMSMNSSAQTYRDMGYLPASGTTVMSSVIGHGVFEVPASDKLAMAAGMEGMKMATDGKMPMDSMAEMNATGKMPMDSMAEMNATGKMPMDSMTEMDHAEKMPMDSMAEMNATGKMPMDSMAEINHDQEVSKASSENHGDETMSMKEEGEETEAGHSGGDGLTIVKSADAKIDRTIEIGMSDWGYDIENAMVMKGETIRLVISNNGNTPHEFMLMSMAGMKAINYRLRRADWNLLEHEALFEVPVMMPGDTVEAVIKIEESGMWMFMCMFPYHMQMGMMSMMMTPDMVGMMGGM